MTAVTKYFLSLELAAAALERITFYRAALITWLFVRRRAGPNDAAEGEELGLGGGPIFEALQSFGRTLARSQCSFSSLNIGGVSQK